MNNFVKIFFRSVCIIIFSMAGGCFTPPASEKICQKDLDFAMYSVILLGGESNLNDNEAYRQKSDATIALVTIFLFEYNECMKIAIRNKIKY